MSLRKAERSRLQDTIVRHLEDFPRQYTALENAMAKFGDDFDLQPFKEAFHSDDMDAYNEVQAVERSLGRVQNFVAELADSGAMLAELPRPPMSQDGSEAQRAFEALRDAKVIDKGLCRRLVNAQKARSRIEHTYVRVPAGDVHRGAQLVFESSREFIGAYRPWIEPFLREGVRAVP